MSSQPKILADGMVIEYPNDLIDFYQLGDFHHQFQGMRHLSRIGTCKDPDRRDALARRVSPDNPVRVVLIGKPVPRDPDRFRYLSYERPARLPPGFALPSPEAMGRQSLDRIVETQRRGIDGN